MIIVYLKVMQKKLSNHSHLPKKVQEFQDMFHFVSRILKYSSEMVVYNTIERNLKAFTASLSHMCMLDEDFSNAIFKLIKNDEGVDDGKPLW